MAEYGKCSSTPRPIGQSACINAPVFFMLRGAVLATQQQQFDTQADFEDQDKWLEGIANQELHPLAILLDDLENMKADDVIVETTAQTKIFVKDGQGGAKIKLRLSPDQHARLRAYNGKSWNLYKFDDRGTIQGRKAGNGVVKGIELDYFRVYTKEEAFGQDQVEYTVIEWRYADPEQTNEDVIYALADNLKSTWEGSVKDTLITPLTQIIITPTALSTDTFNFTAYDVVEHVVNGGPISVPITSILTADAIVRDSVGAVIAEATVADGSEEGLFTVTNAADAATIEIIASKTNLFYSVVTSLP